MNEETNPQQFGGLLTPDLGDLKKHWGWMLALGIVFLILGTIGLGMELFLTVASVLFFGVLLLFGGGVQLVHAFMYCKGWKGILSHSLTAILYIATGVIMVNNPLVASTLITLIIGLALVMVGVLRAISAFQHRGSGPWTWTLFSGVLSIIIGLMIMSSWPYSGLWVIGLFVAIELIIAGWSYILMALAIRRIEKESAGTGDATAE